MLGVAILIIVMSVMNGFKTDLTKKILGLNPHIVIQPNGSTIEDKYLSQFKNVQIMSVDGVNCTWDLYNEHFLEYYNQVMIYISNKY